MVINVVMPARISVLTVELLLDTPKYWSSQLVLILRVLASRLTSPETGSFYSETSETFQPDPVL